VKKYWSLVPSHDEEEEGENQDMVGLPSTESDLDPGQTHHFGFVMDLDADFPNMAVITAHDCHSSEEISASKEMNLD